MIKNLCLFNAIASITLAIVGILLHKPVWEILFLVFAGLLNLKEAIEDEDDG